MADVAAAPAQTTAAEPAAEPAAVKRVSARTAAARQDPEAELRREWKEAVKARKLKLVEAKTHDEPAAAETEGHEIADAADDTANTQTTEAADAEQPEAKTPWAQKVKADLADAQARVQEFEAREQQWTEANRAVQHAHEDLSDDLAHVRGYATQLEALLKSIGKEIDPVSKAHFDGQREIAKLKRQIERGQGVTRAQQSAAQQETLQSSAKQTVAGLAAKFPELRGAKQGTPAGDYIELELSRWVRTGNFDGVEGRAAAWVATQRTAKPAPAKVLARPALRPESTTLAGERGGSSAKIPAPKGGQKFISDKDIKAELRSLRTARGG